MLDTLRDRVCLKNTALRSFPAFRWKSIAAAISTREEFAASLSIASFVKSRYLSTCTHENLDEGLSLPFVLHPLVPF